MPEKAVVKAGFWQFWTVIGALASTVSAARLVALHPDARAAVAAASAKRASPKQQDTVVEGNALPVAVDPLLARLAVAESGAERCELLGRLEPSEDPQITYAITAVLERTLFVSTRTCATVALSAQHSSVARSWLVDLAEDPEPEVHGAALEALAASEDPSARAVVVEATHSESTELALAAATALMKAGRAEAFPALLHLLPSVEDRSTLVSLIGALGQTHDARALPVLDSLVENADTDSHLQAISALGELGAPAARSRLEALLEVGSEAEFNVAAVSLATLAPDAAESKFRSLLAARDDFRHGLALSALLERDPPDRIALLSHELGSADEQHQQLALQELARKPEPALEGQLIAFARQRELRNSGSALNALARLGTPGALEALQQIAHLDPDDQRVGKFEIQEPGTEEELRARRIARLGGSKGAARRAFMQLASDPSDAAQSAALSYAEGAGRGEETLAMLVAAAPVATVQRLVDRRAGLNPEERRALIRGLGQRGEPRFADVLKSAVHDEDADTRGSAVRGLVDMGDDSSSQELSRLTRSSESSDRVLAVELSSARKGAETTRELERLTGDQDANVASGALHALETRAPEQVASLAQRAFRTASPENRVALLSSLGDLKGSLARPLYELALREGDETSATQAVQSLINLEGPESAQLLLGVVNDVNRSPELRSDAAAGLRRLGGPLALSNRALLDALSPPQDEGDQCATPGY